MLEAGFDGYYGSFFNLKEWNNKNQLINHILFNREIANQFSDKKSVIGSFSTHDELSPILVNGMPYSEMIIWLNSTMPVNAYYPDGFPTGDNYIYDWANQKSDYSFTDDDYYFAHRGKIDIFNFSRKPGGNNKELLKEFIRANEFRNSIADLLSNGNFIQLKTNKDSIFAYAINYNNSAVVVFGNLDFDNSVLADIKLPKINKNTKFKCIKCTGEQPIFKRGKISTNFCPGAIYVLQFEDLVIE